MKFAEFEQRAWQEWEKIPARYRGGIDALVIERDARGHPDKDEIYTLGECVTETWPSDYGGPDTTRSQVILYYGSFRRLAAGDPDFDWEAEIWETLTHELQHHLESLADDEGLLDSDAAMEQHFARRDGEPFDPFYYRAGERLSGGAYRLEEMVFLEIELADGMAGTAAAGAGRAVRFEWEGTSYRATDVPVTADVVFAEVVEGVEPAPAELHLVVLFPKGRRGALRALLRRRGPSVAECKVRAERVDHERA